MKTNWEGLWQSKTAVYRSKPLTQAQIKELPKKSRLIVRYNKFHTNNDGATPKFVFCFADAEDADAIALDFIEQEKEETQLYVPLEIAIEIAKGVLQDAENGYSMDDLMVEVARFMELNSVEK